MNETTATKGGAGQRLLRTVLAFALAFSGALATLSSALPGKAYAAEAVLVDTGERFDFYQTNHLNGSHWADSRFQINGEEAFCIDITTTAHPGYSYYSTGMDSGMALRIGLYKQYLDENYQGWSFLKRAGYLQYMIWCEYTPDYMAANVEPDNADFWGVYDGAKAYYGAHAGEYEAYGTEWHSDDSQNMCVAPTIVPKGNIELFKSTGNRAVSDGNACYSLAGAVYTVYSDSGLTRSAGTITTDASGYGKLERVSSGTYWVKETSPSPGFALDENAYQVSVSAGQTAKVNGNSGSTELPQSDPVGMLLGKVDATTEANRPEGSAALDNAEFTVKYYAGFFGTADAADASGTLKDTWVFKTDSDGFAYYADEYKLSGGALYHQTNGDATLPLGTVVVQETKAPVGYNLDDGKGGAPKRFCIQITSSGPVGESVYTYNSPSIPDTVKRGDYRLVKEVPVSIYSEGGGDMPQEVKRVLLPGVKFQLINSSENAIVSPETGMEVQPGGVVCTITTDENGLASTRNGAAVNGWGLPKGWSAALAYGTYTVHEVIPADVAAKFKAEYGKDLIAVPDWKTTISEEGQYDAPVLVNNHIPQTPLKIMKTDAETGRQIPLSCSFQLLDSAGRTVTYTSHYPDTQVMDTWTTNEKGEVMLPMLLEEGSYTIVEVQAPYGYVKALEGKSFNVGAVYNDWNSPIVVDFADMPQNATISVVKHDLTNGEPVDDSTYIVRAAADIVTGDGTVRAHAGDIVATLVTDKDGRATTPELYLGTYTVYEAKAKDGFALDTAEKTVTLEYKGQDVAVYDEELPVTDVPTELRLKKVDAKDPDKAVAGAKFRLWNDEGTVDEELVTDVEGMIDVPYMKHGAYHIQETEAPEGYVLSDVDEDGNAIVHDLFVNDQGMFEDEDGNMTAVFEIVVENMPKSMHTTATDAASGTHEGQARKELTIKDVIEYTGTIPGNEYRVTGKLMDKETGEPATDASGNEIAAETTFKADGFEGEIEVEFTFDGANLAGRHLVAFETMEHEDKEYMVHADIEDVDQTVNVIDIHTTATNPETGDNTGLIADRLDLVDVVAYEGLTPGKAYELVGHLIDSEDGDLVLDKDGIAYISIVKFTPESPDGTVEVPFRIDSTDMAGKTTVFTEYLHDENGNTVATHEDKDDEGQSVHFADIHTNAVDAADGDKNVLATEKAKVTDTVTYENLIPGKEYVLTGRLMDKATGEPLKDAKGNEVTSQVTFTPEKASGTVDVTFEFDATGLDGKTSVAFETLTKDGVEVAIHADIDDEAQTVDIVKDEPAPEPEGKGYPKTGAVVATAAAAGTGGLALLYWALAGGGSALLKRRKGSEEDILDE